MSTNPAYPPDNPDESLDADEAIYEEAEEVKDSPPVVYRGAGSDSFFGYLIGVALAIGLTPISPDNSDMRYVIVWGVLAAFGVLAWLLGNITRIEQEKPDNLAWGVVFGLLIGTPLLAVGGSTLVTTVHLLFRVTTLGQPRSMTPGEVLALVIFVQPLAETLFFRGVLQENRPFWLVGTLSSVWSIVLFFPMLDVFGLPGVAVVIGTALVMVNFTYSYVRRRNGLAAAWLCQIVANFVLLFLPFIGGV